MKTERIVISLYAILGILTGIASFYLKTLIAILLALFVYVILTIPSVKFFTGKKRKWFIQNSFITFSLIWLVVWIVLYTG